MSKRAILEKMVYISKLIENKEMSSNDRINFGKEASDIYNRLTKTEK